MNTIRLDDKYEIKKDAYCWILCYSNPTGRFSKHGEPISDQNIWYYPTIKQCLLKYMDEVIYPASSVTELYAKLLEVEETIKTLKL